MTFPLWLLILGSFVPGMGSVDEERLIEDLMWNYQSLIRPVTKKDANITVYFGVALIQIINVDEKNQIIKNNVWLRHRWKDYQLTWDPQEYGYIEVLRLPSEKVWVPDIVLFNNADGHYEPNSKVNVLISYDGQVEWIPAAIFQTSCTIDVRYFPYDEQTCDLKFGSWTYSYEELVLGHYKEGLDRIDVNDYVLSGTWDLIKCPAEIENDPRAKNNRTSPAYIRYAITIRRKTLFYTINLVVPCLLLSCLSILVFYLPSDSGEKMTLAISLLLALVVFLLLVSKILPPTSLSIPLVAKYLLLTFIMNIVTIIVTVVIINWNYRGPTTHRMPPWMRKLFVNYLPKFLCLHRPKLSIRSDHARRGSTQYSLLAQVKQRRGGMSASSDEKTEFLDTRHHHPNCKLSRSEMAEYLEEADEDDIAIVLTPDAKRTVSAVDFIAEHLRMEDDVIEIKEDWRFVAMVVDRLLLYVFFSVTAAGTMALILGAPNVFENVDQKAILEELKQF